MLPVIPTNLIGTFWILTNWVRFNVVSKTEYSGLKWYRLVYFIKVCIQKLCSSDDFLYE